MDYKCRDCDKVFEDNPARCDKCGNSILVPVKKQEKITDNDLSMKQLKGEHISDNEVENQSLSDRIKRFFK